MSAFESRVSFQETSKFYSLVLHRVLTKSDHLPARLLCAGASPSGSSQPNQTEVFLCSVCVDAQVFPCPSSQPCVCSGTFKMWTFGKVQWAATTTGVKSTNRVLRIHIHAKTSSGSMEKVITPWSDCPKDGQTNRQNPYVH